MVKLTRWQEGTLGFVLVVDLLMPVLSVLVSMSNKMPVGAVVVFCALVALACLGLMRLVDRQPGRLGLPASVTGPKVLRSSLRLLRARLHSTSRLSRARHRRMLVLMGSSLSFSCRCGLCRRWLRRGRFRFGWRRHVAW